MVFLQIKLLSCRHNRLMTFLCTLDIFCIWLFQVHWVVLYLLRPLVIIRLRPNIDDLHRWIFFSSRHFSTEIQSDDWSYQACSFFSILSMRLISCRFSRDSLHKAIWLFLKVMGAACLTRRLLPISPIICVKALMT